MRGDSDSVCAVVGQICGAIYGFQAIPQAWLESVLKWDPPKDLYLRVYKLLQLAELAQKKEEEK